MNEIIEEMDKKVNMLIEEKQSIEKELQKVEQIERELEEQESAINELPDKDSDEFKRKMRRINKSQEENQKNYDMLEDKAEELEETACLIKRTFLEKVQEKRAQFVKKNNDATNKDEQDKFGRMIENIVDFECEIEENFNMSNIEEMRESIDIFKSKVLDIEASEKDSSGKDNGEEVTEKRRPVLTNYKASRNWELINEDGITLTSTIGGNSIEDGEKASLKKMISELGLTEEQVEDVDIEACKALVNLGRFDLFNSYLNSFKSSENDKGFDMCYDQRTKGRKIHKVDREYSKERDRIAKRHKKLGIATRIKDKISNKVKGIVAVALVTVTAFIGANKASKLDVGKIMPKIEDNREDKNNKQNDKDIEKQKQTKNKNKSKLNINPQNIQSIKIKTESTANTTVPQAITFNTKDTENNKNNNDYKFIGNPFIQENNITFEEYMKQQNQTKKEKSEQENADIDQNNKTQSYGVNVLACRDVIFDMMEPYCKAKVGGRIYVDPSDSLLEHLGRKAGQKVIVASEKVKDSVYAKSIIRYQTDDGKKVCFNLEDYEKDIKEGNIRDIMLNIDKALKNEGLDFSYLINDKTEKMYLLEAPEISQWMRADDTITYQFELDEFGNKIEKTPEKNTNKSKSTVKVGSQNIQSRKNENVNTGNTNPTQSIGKGKIKDKNVASGNLSQYKDAEFKKEDNAQVTTGSAIVVDKRKDVVANVVSGSAIEGSWFDKYQKEVEAAQERQDLMTEAIKEQIEVDEEER